MKWYYITGMIVVICALLWVNGCTYNQLTALKKEKADLIAENNLLSDTKPDTTYIVNDSIRYIKLKGKTILKRDTCYKYLDTLDVSRVVLSDTGEDDRVKVWYTADIFGNLNDMVLGYKLKAPDTVRISTPYIVDNTKPETWHAEIVATGYSNGLSVGLNYVDRTRWIIGIGYHVNQKSIGVTAGYRLR